MNKDQMSQAEKDLKSYGYKSTSDGYLKKDDHIVKPTESGKSYSDNKGNTYTSNRDLRNGARKD